MIPPPQRAALKAERLKGRWPLRLRIASPSDEDSDPRERLLWGDHWIKLELAREFESLGIEMVDEAPDVLLYFYGGTVRPLPDDSLNIVWVYSHPDRVTPENLMGFDRMYCASPRFTEKLKAMGYTWAEPLIAASSKRPLTRPHLFDLVFVGNARKVRPEGRKIIGDLGPTRHNLKVWGARWETILPEKQYGGRYWDYGNLEELYASARISLNDHQPDMAREGFVAARLYDILAGGGFALSDANPGIAEVFGDSVPQYEDAADLREKVDFFLAHPERREELRIEGQRIALTHTFRDRAMTLAREFGVSDPPD